MLAPSVGRLVSIMLFTQGCLVSLSTYVGSVRVHVSNGDVIVINLFKASHQELDRPK